MKVKPSTLAVLGAALAPSFANAIGLGDIILLSRVGEPLRAEVPIVAGPGDTPETLCFALGSVRSADFPVVTAAKTRVVQRGRDFRLQILGSKPVYDPIVVVGLRAGCGADLQRDYVLMPEPPLMVADAPEAAAPAAAAPAAPAAAVRPPAVGSEWQAHAGETLAGIAQARTAAKPADRQRLLAAMKRANPQFAADEPLPEGTPVRIPKLRPRQPPPPKPEATTAAGGSPAAPTPAPPPAQAAAPAAASPSDRLLLGAAPEDSRTPRSKSPQAASLAEMEERMGQMESTLRLLRAEIEKMDAALQLADKTVEAERKLREVQSAQLATAQAQAAPPAPQGGNWLELLLSAVVGGGLAVGIASFLGRRRLPEQSLLPPLSAAPTATGQASRLDDLLETITDAPDAPPTPAEQPSASPAALEASEDRAVMALAEVMLSYGRLQGAAETLADHVHEHSPDNILPWIMLIDLYRRCGMRPEFESLARAIHGKFNVETATWEEHETPVSGLRSLEEYPHIVHQIGATWGSPAGLDYLYELVHDTRAGQRQGFPLEVVEEMALLIHILEDGYGLRRSL